MNHEEINPVPIKHKYFTPGVFILLIIALNGLIFLMGRFFFGLGSVTNLNDQYPWGLWIGVDVAAGVALAAGGFTTAALGHVMHKEEYNAIIRPALLTAMLGYTFVAMGVFVDIGRWYFIWHPLIMWNGSSALFEVGICVMIYMSVLYIEFLCVIIMEKGYHFPFFIFCFEDYFSWFDKSWVNFSLNFFLYFFLLILFVGCL